MKAYLYQNRHIFILINPPENGSVGYLIWCGSAPNFVQGNNYFINKIKIEDNLNQYVESLRTPELFQLLQWSHFDQTTLDYLIREIKKEDLPSDIEEINPKKLLTHEIPEVRDFIKEILNNETAKNISNK